MYDLLAPQEKNWESYYRDFKSGKLSKDYELFKVAKLGANIAEFYLSHYIILDVSLNENQRKIKETLSKVYKLIDAAASEMQKKRPPKLANAYKLWYRAYALGKLRRYESLELFEQAYPRCRENCTFLLDYGRFTYNFGWFDIAFKRFSEAENFISQLQEEKQPNQVFRWLSKSARITGNFTEENRLLRLLEERCNFSKRSNLYFHSDDCRESLKFFVRRLARNLLDINDPTGAFTHVDETIGAETDANTQLLLVEQGIEALNALGSDDQATEFAQFWSAKLNDPSPLARNCFLSKKRFTARQAFKNWAEITEKKLDNQNSEAEIFYSDATFSSFEPISVPTAATVYRQFAEAAFENGLFNEGIEFALKSSAIAINKSVTRFLASILQTVLKLRRSFPEDSRIEDLYKEAATSFPNDAFIQLQYGYYLLDTKDFQNARLQLEHAIELAESEPRLAAEHGYEVYLGLAFAETGDIERAIALWEEVLPSCDADWSSDCYEVPVRWAVENSKEELAIKFCEDFLAGHGSLIWSSVKARPVLECAAQAAFMLCRWNLALKFYDMLVVNYSSYVTAAQDNIDRHELAVQAFPQSMSGIVYAFSGEQEKASCRIAIARQFDPNNELIPIAEAVVAINYGDYVGAARQFFSTNAPLWIIASLGPAILDSAEINGMSSDEATHFRTFLSTCDNAMPNLEQIIAKNQQQTKSLIESIENAETRKSQYEALAEAAEQLVDELAEENLRLKAVSASNRERIRELEKRLSSQKFSSGQSAGNVEKTEVARFREVFSNITFESDTLEQILTFNQKNFRSVIRTLGLIQYSPDQFVSREKSVNMDGKGTVYESSFPGNGRDSGRLYFAGGGNCWALKEVGYKSTQKKDIARLKRHPVNKL